MMHVSEHSLCESTNVIWWARFRCLVNRHLFLACWYKSFWRHFFIWMLSRMWLGERFIEWSNEHILCLHDEPCLLIEWCILCLWALLALLVNKQSMWWWCMSQSIRRVKARMSFAKWDSGVSWIGISFSLAGISHSEGGALSNVIRWAFHPMKQWAHFVPAWRTMFVDWMMHFVFINVNGCLHVDSPCLDGE